MLVGKFPVKLDSKNRFLMPSRLRSDLTEKLVLTKGTKGKILTVFTESEFMKNVNEIKNNPNLTPESKYKISMFLSANAVSVELDSSSRILLPQDLRAYLGLGGNDVMLLGLIDKVQIWNPEDYEREQVTADDLDFEVFI